MSICSQCYGEGSIARICTERSTRFGFRPRITKFVVGSLLHGIRLMLPVLAKPTDWHSLVAALISQY